MARTRESCKIYRSIFPSLLPFLTTRKKCSKRRVRKELLFVIIHNKSTWGRWKKNCHNISTTNSYGAELKKLFHSLFWAHFMHIAWQNLALIMCERVFLALFSFPPLEMQTRKCFQMISTPPQPKSRPSSILLALAMLIKFSLNAKRRRRRRRRWRSEKKCTKRRASQRRGNNRFDIVAAIKHQISIYVNVWIVYD